MRWVLIRYDGKVESHDELPDWIEDDITDDFPEDGDQFQRLINQPDLQVLAWIQANKQRTSYIVKYAIGIE